LQLPSRWQVVAPSFGHSLSGSVPALMLPHVPSAPLPFFVAEHAWHAPLQALSQQTLSTQLPLWHWDAEEQVAPLAWSGWQV
jgi:hypothetical protein